MGLDAFAKPQKLLDRAKRALDHSHATFQAFVQGDGFTTVVQYDPEAGHNVRKVVLQRPLPDEIEGGITDALNNARNAFDQALYAACFAIGKPLRDGHYPWVDEERLLQGRLHHAKKGKDLIPPELWDTIRAHEPYPRSEAEGRGDTLVRSMATLANRKHTVGIEVGCRVSGVQFSNVSFENLAGGFLSLDVPRWDPVKNEVVLARWSGPNQPQFKGEEQVMFYVTFDESAPGDLHGVHAHNATLALVKAAQRVLDTFKARAVELGAT